jgi:hypothetical protein
MPSTSPSALRSSTNANGWPSGGRCGSSPCAATSAAWSLLAMLNGLPPTAVVAPTRNLSAAGSFALHGSRHAEHIRAVVFGQRRRAAVVQQRLPLGPGAGRRLVLQPAHQRERPALPVAAGLQLQRAVVVKQLGHPAHAHEHVAARAPPCCGNSRTPRAWTARCGTQPARRSPGRGRRRREVGRGCGGHRDSCHCGPDPQSRRWRANMDPGPSPG